MHYLRSTNHSASRGLTLVEVTIVLTITGLLIEALVTGQGLIYNARVHDIVSQQSAVESAFQAFQDRFHALPGDYAAASSNINCGATPCLNGNGNFRIEAGTGGAIHEEILAWQHLSAAGFLRGGYVMANASVAVPAPDNTAANVFDGYLEIVYDSSWGYSGNSKSRHNIKTGNNIPAAVLAEVDRKIDDGQPGSGRFQFSTYAGAGTAPVPGGTPNGCTDANSATALWIQSGGSDNCGAASLLF
jgi:Tfp pilus assembly protein PilE